jgi:hypothetical protein
MARPAPKIDEQVSSGGRGVPVIRYIDRDDAEWKKVLMARSSTLFALPSNVGFSAPLRQETIAGSIPDPAATLPEFMREMPEVKPAAYGQTVRQLEESVKEVRLHEVPRLDDQSSQVALRASTDSKTFTFYWQDQPNEPVAGLDLAGLPVPTGAVPWRAIFYVCANQAGAVERMLIEQPAPTAGMNDVLGRFIRGMRFPAVNGEFCRRLVVRYHPPVPVKGGGS